MAPEWYFKHFRLQLYVALLYAWCYSIRKKGGCHSAKIFVFRGFGERPRRVPPDNLVVGPIFDEISRPISIGMWWF